MLRLPWFGFRSAPEPSMDIIELGRLLRIGPAWPDINEMRFRLPTAAEDFCALMENRVPHPILHQLALAPLGAIQERDRIKAARQAEIEAAAAAKLERERQKRERQEARRRMASDLVSALIPSSNPSTSAAISDAYSAMLDVPEGPAVWFKGKKVRAWPQGWTWYFQSDGALTMLAPDYRAQVVERGTWDWVGNGPPRSGFYPENRPR
jgi:hypothetical protein